MRLPSMHLTDDVIPSHLCTVQFFYAAATRLNPEGIIIVNSIVSHHMDRLADCIGASIREASQLPVMIFDEPGCSPTVT